MNAAPVTNHAEQMVQLLLTQFANRQEVTAFVREVLAPQVQTIEDVVAALQVALDPETAVGDSLDKLGWIVGQSRLAGESDDIYRRKIRARMARNRSRGKRSDLNLVAKLFVGDTFLSAIHWPSWPAGFGMALALSALLTAEQKAGLREFLLGTKSGGVDLAGLAQYQAPVFGFAGSGNPDVLGFDQAAWADFF